MKKYLFFGLTFLLSCSAGKEPAKTETDAHSIVANPMNLNYRFQFNDPGWREAADPVCEYFKGKYYLFASKSGGYWSSPDLKSWDFIPTKKIETIENYAPTILVLDDTLYFMASWEPVKIYKTANPDSDDNWELVDSKFHFNAEGSQDPAFYRDDDGKVYMYWGCSNVHPIYGVEVDPANGFAVMGDAVPLIEHHSDRYGWESSGENNERNRDGWNEGPCMIKYNGKYYLQYAAPGTEFRIYADGAYTGDSPLGPFTYLESNPFSFKAGGFAGGAGHGHTFLDKYGNYWHVATIKISQRHTFERRLGLFPLYFTKDGLPATQTVWTDYPFVIPDGKTDFSADDRSAGWNLLSFRKTATASSELPGFPAANALNEEIENRWSAATGNPGEWFCVDLKAVLTVRALQINFADQDFTIRAPHEPFAYQYVVESSGNGVDWETLIDRSRNTKDAVHELTVPDNPVKTRYLRITNRKDLPGKFSLYGFRVFGEGNGKRPAKVTGVRVVRNPEDHRRYSLTWDKQDNATGYIVRTGINREQLLNAVMVYDNRYEGGFFNRDSRYYFAVEAFNENGVTSSTGVFEA
ncbi:MAG: family 43 glycosylhydrolase, partial [Tannerella sp.]|nr:family 43 glycosylhydrolase [Tannerella sp.]